jgi:hypothetical protein
MKIVPIKDVRVGQVWKLSDKSYVVDVIHDDAVFCRIADTKKDNVLIPNAFSQDDFEAELTLMGFLNITHREENGKLVEIPRMSKIQKDDIVECYGNSIQLVDMAYLNPDNSNEIKEASCVNYNRNRLYVSTVPANQIRLISPCGVNYEIVPDVLAGKQE